MSFSDAPETGASPITKLVLGAIVGIAIAVFAGLGLKGGDLFTPSPESIEREVDELTENDPHIGAIFRALRKHYPREFARYKTEQIELVQSRPSRIEARAAGKKFMMDFWAKHQADFKAAPDEHLFMIRDANDAAVKVLAEESVEQCANYGMTGLLPTDNPSPRSIEALSRIGAVQIRAMAAGRDSPAQRAEASEADMLAWAEALIASGMTNQEVDMMFSGTGLANLPKPRQCEITQAVYGSIGMLPDDLSARVSAAVLNPTI